MPGPISESAAASIITARMDRRPLALIAAEHNTSVRTVMRKIANFRNEGRLGRKKYSRAHKLNQQEKENVVDYIRDHPFASTDNVIKSLDLNIKRKTL